MTGAPATCSVGVRPARPFLAEFCTSVSPWVSPPRRGRRPDPAAGSRTEPIALSVGDDDPRPRRLEDTLTARSSPAAIRQNVRTRSSAHNMTVNGASLAHRRLLDRHDLRPRTRTSAVVHRDELDGTRPLSPRRWVDPGFRRTATRSRSRPDQGRGGVEIRLGSDRTRSPGGPASGTVHERVTGGNGWLSRPRRHQLACRTASDSRGAFRRVIRLHERGGRLTAAHDGAM